MDECRNQDAGRYDDVYAMTIKN